MRIPVINKSRRKEVKVAVKPSDTVTIPTPPEEYKADIDEDLLEELSETFIEEEPEDLGFEKAKAKSVTKRQLAEQLARLDAAEMRSIIRAAKHLRKFKDILEVIEEDDNEDELDKLWRKK